MGAYSIDGQSLASVYAEGGSALEQAYDINGGWLLNRPLKIMTYNVGQWYLGNHDNVPADLDEEYYELQNGMIQQNNPDVLFLNEYVKQFSKAGRSAISMLEQYFPYIHEEVSTSVTTGQGRCICSKYPLLNYTVNSFGDASNLYYDSCAIVVNNTPITLIVTHLHWDNRTLRIEEIEKVINLASDSMRFIFAGDLNTLDCKSTSGADYTAIMEPILNAGFNVANNDGTKFLVTYSDSPEGPYTGCLDNIVTSSNITILDSHVDTTKLYDTILEKTDHMPLIATVQIS